jgi:uncharacterized phiE125 gp8 family phage protein
MLYCSRYKRYCGTFPFPYVEQSRAFGLPVSLDSTYKYLYIDQNETIVLNVVSITRIDTVATVTIATPHYLSTGKTVTIAGAVEGDYNGDFVVTVTSETEFTYTVAGSPTTPATGTITATYTGVDLEDASLVTSFIKASMDCFEAIARRVLINTTFITYRDCWCYCMELRKSPLVSITSLKYNDEDENEQTVSSDDYYTTKDPFYSKILFVDGFDFPTLSTRQQSIFIEFIAGYGTSEADIPNDIQLAIKAHVSFLWENRGDCPNASDKSCMPCQTRTTFQKYKVEEI